MSYSGVWYFYEFGEKEYNYEDEYEYSYECVSHDFYPTLGLGVITYDKEIEFTPKFCEFDRNWKIKELIFPESVFCITESSCNSCSNLEKVSVAGDGSVYVGESAFGWCEKLKEVNIPRMEYIYDDAFSPCFSLKSINLGNCSWIGDSAFSECHLLESVYLDSRVGLGDWVFDNCVSLVHVIFSEQEYANYGDAQGSFMDCNNLHNFPKIEGYVDDAMFYRCNNLKSIDLSEVEIVGEEAFYKTPIEKVNLENVFEIRDNAFLGCKNLKYVFIGEGLEALKASAFSDCDNLETFICKSEDFEDTEINLSFDGWRNIKHIDVMFSHLPSLDNSYETLEKLILRYDGVVEIESFDSYASEDFLSVFRIYVPEEYLDEYKETYPNMANRFLPIYGDAEENSSGLTVTEDDFQITEMRVVDIDGVENEEIVDNGSRMYTMSKTMVKKEQLSQEQREKISALIKRVKENLIDFKNGEFPSLPNFDNLTNILNDNEKETTI